MDNGDELYAMQADMQGAQMVGGETVKRISRLPVDYFTAVSPCSADMVHGSYVYHYDGNLIMTPAGSTQPIAAPFYYVGLSWSDNTGRSFGKAVSNVAGTVSSGGWTSDPGALQVNADCTGSISWSLSGPGAPAGQGMDRFVLLDGGREMWSVTTKGMMGQPSFVGVYKRISEQPAQ
jgi:hypothetical protein